MKSISLSTFRYLPCGRLFFYLVCVRVCESMCVLLHNAGGYVEFGLNLKIKWNILWWDKPLKERLKAHYANIMYEKQLPERSKVAKLISGNRLQWLKCI